MAGNIANRVVSDGQESGGFMAFLAEKKEKLDKFQAEIAQAIMPSMPGQPAGKYQDIAIGIDMHPTFFPPSPIMAVPHVGMVFDIMGALFAAINTAIPPTPEPPAPEQGESPEPQPLTVSSVAVAIVKAMAPSVMVNNKFIANAGVSIQHLPGVVLHALPSVSPMASSEMFMGSSTVLADGAPFSGQFLPALSCNLIGMPAPFRPTKPKVKMSLMAPTSSLVTVLPGGMPVLVGGPPTIDLMALMMSLGLKGLGKLGRKAGGSLLNKTKKGWQKLGDKFQKKIDNLAPKNPKAAKRLQPVKCKLFGEPVDAATGRVTSENLDFSLPGPIPLEWSRFYFSDAEIPSPIGSNWQHSYNIGYWEISEEVVCLQFPDGRQVNLPQLANGDMLFNRKEKITWFKDSKGVAYKGEDGLTYRFATNANSEGFYPINAITNEFGNQISFEYRHDVLRRIIDSTGRVLEVEQRNNRISAIYAIIDNERVNFIRYKIDHEDNLVKVTDANDVSKHFYYDGHLLVKLTNQSGLSFYWEYQGKGDNAQCIHTWGDEGILEYWTQYEEGKTIVTNSLGHTTTYYHDADKLIYRITDAKGGETYQDYNELQYLETVTDPLGNTTKYKYDMFGNLVSIEDADKNTTTFEYDAMQRLIDVTKPSGNMSWQYDEDGKLITRSFTDGTRLQYEYDENNQLVAMTDDARNRTTFTWNDHHELVKATLNDGRNIQWRYDALGNVVRNVQPNGAITTYEYDVLGNVTGLKEPDGNKHTFEYDNAGNVTLAKDAHREVAFTYWGLGNLKTRTENGKTITFKYNTEEQLTTIVNENKQSYRFTLDPLGQIIAEWGFDGLQRRYIRDAVGRVTKVLRPEQRYTKYMYSGTGNILVAEHHDGTGEYFTYDGNGNLKEATNQFNTVKFAYKKGKLVSEDQNGHLVESVYNRLGQRTQITSSLGANIAQEFAKDGTLASTKANGWEANYKRDALGLEIQRMVSGDVTINTQRDTLGRVTQHQVQNKNVEARRVNYQWGRADRLLSMVNGLTNKKVRYSYDEVGNLASASYKNGLETIYKMPDAVGNIFKSPSRNDREYGAGGKLLKDENASYKYDSEGNLSTKFVSKADKPEDIGEWTYEWFGNGMLKAVHKPNHQFIQFEYDALGRRTAKIVSKQRRHPELVSGSHASNGDTILNELASKTKENEIKEGTITRFIWDGNIPLHEWKYNLKERPQLFVNEFGDIALDSEEPISENLTTWVFENNSFVPQAKIVGDKKYSVICDYLGTPVQAFDEDGEKIWERELDIYGTVREETANKNFIPFRFSGQFFDEETGLCYSRFRYYDPSTGIFTQQDPIGLASGEYNLYSYVRDSNSWTDVLGLSGVPIDRFPSWMDTMQGYERHHIISYEFRNHQIFEVTGMNVNNATNMVYLPVHESVHPTKAVHHHFQLNGKPHADYNKMIGAQLDDLYNRSLAESWSIERTRKELLNLQHQTRERLNNARTNKKIGYKYH